MSQETELEVTALGIPLTDGLPEGAIVLDVFVIASVLYPDGSEPNLIRLDSGNWASWAVEGALRWALRDELREQEEEEEED